jgi:hypothetical protein
MPEITEPLGENVPAAEKLMELFSTSKAQRYIDEQLIPGYQRSLAINAITLDHVRSLLLEPIPCLRILYGFYSFTRRGKEREELVQTALRSLNQIIEEVGEEKFLSQDDAVNLWEVFCQVSEDRGRKPQENLNRGVIQGLAELAQEVYQLRNIVSIGNWIQKGVQSTGRIEPTFMRIVDVRGVGPKLTSLFLRDAVELLQLESQIEFQDRLFLQPIDKWIRLAAPFLVNEITTKATADWVLAGKLSKTIRRAGLSGIRVNMGASYFGAREVKLADGYEAAVQALLKGETILPGPMTRPFLSRAVVEQSPDRPR